jgi:hypothetical protein
MLFPCLPFFSRKGEVAADSPRRTLYVRQRSMTAEKNTTNVSYPSGNKGKSQQHEMHVIRSPYYYRKPLPMVVAGSRSDIVDTEMEMEIIKEVLEAIGKSFDHVPYAVCGLAAMCVYGYTSRLPTHISIVCPSYSKDVIKCWAAVKGMLVSGDQPDKFGFRTSDGKLRDVRIKYMNTGFDGISTILFGPNETKLCSLPSLIDQVAKAFTMPNHHRASNYHHALALDIFWLLHRIIDEMAVEQVLSPGKVPHVIRTSFWERFTTTYPDAVVLFSDAGLGAPRVLGGRSDTRGYQSSCCGSATYGRSLTSHQVRESVFHRSQRRSIVAARPTRQSSRTSSQYGVSEGFRGSQSSWQHNRVISDSTIWDRPVLTNNGNLVDNQTGPA